MKVLYIATECKPFSKIGGIGDVTGELPVALKKQGVDIEVVTPWYGCSRVEDYTIDCHGAKEPVGIIPSHLRGVPIHFVKNSRYFEGNYSSIYIHSDHIPFYDDAIRFSFFSKACLQIVKEKKPDIVHINDWGLAYLFVFMEMEQLPQKRVITIHNVGYQGNIRKEHIQNTEMKTILDHESLGYLFNDPRSMGESVNALALGLQLCDCAHTVSPRYAEEITMPEDQSRYFTGGCGLDQLAKRLYNQKRLIGILNGFEYDEAPTQESLDRCLNQKRNKKKIIGKRFSNPESFLIGFVGRAVEQKFKLLTEIFEGAPIMEHILNVPDVNVIVLATGLAEYESFLRRYQDKPNFSATIRFDPIQAKDIILGSDLFLLPSLYEPCGITQMEALSFATLPFVRRTGGLVNTVKPHTKPDGTGFWFDGSTREEILSNLIKTIREARDLFFNHRQEYQKLQKNAFNAKFLWETTAKEYINKIYQPVIRGDISRKSQRN
jgi:starch synthase